jgi:photosystem II stability/assembly factor-like uncharacterized protein
MKKYIYIVFLFIVAEIALADDFGFTPERMITDFHGVVYNGKNVLAYGDYGIITFSEDRGMNWQQLNIGDKYNIKKIRTINSDFFGVTEFSVIKSTTNGKSWINNEITETPDIISCAVDNNSVYILTKYSVLRCNNNLDFETNPLIEFDARQKYTEIEYHNDYIFILSNNDTLEQKHILKINPENGISEKLSLMTVKHQPSDDVKLSNMKFYENTIYYTNEITNFQYPGAFPSYYFIKSADNGKSWDRFYFRFCLVNFIENDKIYNLRYRNSQIALSVLEDSPHPDSLAIETVITDTSSPPERYQSLLNQSLKDVINISKDTMVAVGVTKTIAVTVDGGKKWILKSRYRYQLTHDLRYYSVNAPPVFINNKTIFNSNRYRTFDGGITWLPPLTSENENINKWYSDIYYFDKDGTGMTIKNDGGGLYMLKTNDYGETYTQSVIYPPIINRLAEKEKRGVKIKDKIYFPYTKNSEDVSFIYVFNENYELENTTIIDTIMMSNIVSDDTSNLYTIGLSRTNGRTDTNITYSLVKSSNNGDSWEKVIPILPFPSKIYEYLGKPYYSTSVKDIYSFDKFIIMPNLYAEPTVLYLFDTETEILDSLEIPYFLSRGDEAIFSFKGDFYAISSNNTIYRTKNFPSKTAVWDSVHISKYLYDWKDYTPNTDVPDRDLIYSTWTDDEQIYLVVNRSTYDYVAGGLEFMFKPNIVKLFKDEPTSVEEVENVESERVYLWSGNPYPTPTKDMVRTKVYWNSVYDINNARIEFYDLYGSKLINPKYTIEHHNIYSADIVWDCSEYRNGIYFMHVSLAGDTKLVKMMIAK